jgi:hypothetical protein
MLGFGIFGARNLMNFYYEKTHDRCHPLMMLKIELQFMQSCILTLQVATMNQHPPTHHPLNAHYG